MSASRTGGGNPALNGKGTLYGVGLGPGDPELMSLKAARLLGAATTIAYFAKRGRKGHARTIAEAHLPAEVEELRMEYPFTTEVGVDDRRYIEGIAEFYEHSVAAISQKLDAGENVTVICEGDPFFYGSFLHLYDRLAPRYACEVVPGITGMSGCWTAAHAPITHGDDVLTVLPGTLDEEALADRLAACNAAVIMKIGRNFDKVRRAVARAGLADRALYVERGTMRGERVEKLADVDHSPAPYFAIVLVPGRQNHR